MYTTKPRTERLINGICSVCTENVRRLTKLDCRHTFCDRCVSHQKLRVDTMVELNQPITIPCPYCREFFTSLKDKRTDDAVIRRPATVFGYERHGAAHDRNLLKRCQPCREGGEYTDATYWCEDCCEYFCATCSRYHRSMKMSKDHRIRPERSVSKPKYELVSKSKYDMQYDLPASKKNCDPCRKNDKLKTAKFCCNDCSENFCDDCSKCHRTMKVSKNHKMRPINTVFLKVDEYNKDLKCSKHYNEPLSLFCKRCQTSCCTICAISAHSDCKSGGKGKEKKHDIPSWSDMPTWQFTGSTKTKDLFPGFGLQKAETKMKAEKEEKKKKEEKEDRELFFDYDKKLKESKKTEKRRYPVSVTKLRMDHRKTRVGFGSASKEDWVISMAMLTNGDILIITLYQSDLKLIDQGGNVLSSCNFYGDPWSVAAYNDTLAAITFSDRKQIQLVNLNRGLLQQGKKITTKHKSLAVCFAHNLLVTSCWEGCIHVLDITGSEICSILTDHRGERLFSNPEYIASSKGGDVIYVSDFKRNSITALKLLSTRFERKPVFVFTDKELKGPKGITVDDDEIIYVSGMTSRNIFRIFPNGEKIQTFNRREDVEYYEDICISRDGKKLFVSAYEDNTILKFDLKKV